ncbi:HLA class I histocompatibility antigen, alpha chain F-like [Oreochromis aureus]|uniref:HLA class I histocompatibility antigen, alpha chain F-like n=1 Tax=Oreochromis aureus TaxID=47969 RepID=UPI001952A9BC|nr:HLA class I histocompatibility antigen, alpha chain F-like [Oreochromis aureus]
MYWRKDGEEIHEGVDQREILPNNDGTFQMSVDLKLLSVTLEEWQRYDCVFQLSGVSSDIITKLDKTVIRTNREKPTDMVIFISAAMVVLVFILIAAVVSVAYKKKKAFQLLSYSPPMPDNGSEQAERLNQM